MLLRRYARVSLTLTLLVLWLLEPPVRADTTSTHPRRAYVGLLYNNAYSIPVRVLYRSMLRHGLRYPFLLLVTEDVSDDVRADMRADGIDVRPVEVIRAPTTTRDRWTFVYTKLRVWQLTQYDQLAYLDADAVVVDSCMDNVFDACGDHVVCGVSDLFESMGFNAGLIVLRPNNKMHSINC